MSNQLERLIQLSKNHDSASLRYGLGLAYLDEQKPNLAQKEFEKAIKMKPDFAAAWKLLGKAYMEIGNFQAARTAWTEGIRVAHEQGSIQAEKEMGVFLRRLEKS
ncbi:MAG: tetratricopeptide repeat protein [Proteobacteria bacterium]|nr:tetratricopeptide repeat protein [Pseudomonadota bacterium]MDE3208741.1 tetratricopeptide repeat protein [Pseudomonadota bacterium]